MYTESCRGPCSTTCSTQTTCAALSQESGDCVCCNRSSLIRIFALLQEAAGAFAHLRDVASLRVEQPRPVDISPECASMLERLCLAQAQECIFEKARADKKSSAILARCSACKACIAAAVVLICSSRPFGQAKLYKSALSSCENLPSSCSDAHASMTSILPSPGHASSE